MIIKRALNNNVAIAEENNKAFLILGNGVAFKKEKGDIVKTGLIKEIFILEDVDNNLLNTLTPTINPLTIELTSFALNKLKSKFEFNLNNNILLTLSDHLDFAFERAKENKILINPLDNEIKRLYKNEILKAKYLINVIYEKSGILLPREEESFIALHFVNMSLNGNSSKGNMEDTLIVSEISNAIMDILVQYDKNIEEKDILVSRFLTHLKYLILQFIREGNRESKDISMYLFLSKNYPHALIITEKISDFLFKHSNWIVNSEEKAYLMLHINRLIEEE